MTVSSVMGDSAVAHDLTINGTNVDFANVVGSSTALIGAFEALLFSMLGNVVDWLSHVPPTELWSASRGKLLLLAGILLASPLAVALQTFI